MQPLVARREAPPRSRGKRSTLPKGESKKQLIGKWERWSNREEEKCFECRFWGKGAHSEERPRFVSSEKRNRGWGPHDQKSRDFSKWVSRLGPKSMKKGQFAAPMRPADAKFSMKTDPISTTQPKTMRVTWPWTGKDWDLEARKKILQA